MKTDYIMPASILDCYKKKGSKMKFYMPTKVYDETNCVMNHGKEWSSYGERAYIITGRHSAKVNGSLADVEEVLKKYGKAWNVYSDVEENPSVETIMEAAKIGREKKVDFVVGIGGGSPLDAAKAIALMIKHEEADEQYLYDASRDNTTLPVVAIPTTCGTGSEVTGISVLTRHDIKTKQALPFRIFPKIALIDGKYLISASNNTITNTAADALGHMIESYINTNKDDYLEIIVKSGLEVWSRSKEALIGKREFEEADYANMMRAALFGGIAIAQTGTTIPHALSYALTYDLGIPHGRAVGQFLSGYLKESPENERNNVLKWIGLDSVQEFEELIENMIGKEDVPEEIIKRTAKDALNNTAKISMVPFTVDEEVMNRIVKSYSKRI